MPATGACPRPIQTEQSLDTILDHLACSNGAYSEEQAAFLDALDGYMAFQSPSELERARNAVEKMLFAMEGW